ncbi:TetR/AcrR family transcriptional regulator [Anaerosporobacter sp.]|uniref:TetR/AcrR family transcriptional regulator n=1 Tax=Anaerosporobacter sp. TaxID=1872529 RepID=UPI00286EEE91|nr:TetR/AcrR family transcriptional regulator [Anaerosporobacter sp.]
MNKYEMTTQKKKMSIIQSAMLLFREKGVTAITMKEIASHANVSQASIYNYFGSKEAVVAECFNLVMADTFQKANEILGKEMDFHTKLELGLSLCVDDFNQLLSKYFSQEALEDQALMKLLIENINQGKKEIYRKYIELGKEEGVIDVNIPTSIYLGFMEAINTMGSNADIREELNENIDYVHHLFLYGVIGKK